MNNKLYQIETVAIKYGFQMFYNPSVDRVVIKESEDKTVGLMIIPEKADLKELESILKNWLQ